MKLKLVPLSVLILAASVTGLLIYGAVGAAESLSTVDVKVEETSFGDLSTDALCDASGTTVGLMVAKDFLLGTIDGAVTEDKVRGLLSVPDETWVVSRLTGHQIRQALERSISLLPRQNTAFLQVSGLTIQYDPGAPRNNRVTSVKTTNGALNDAQTYEVVMPLSLAKGGSGYFQIFSEDSVARRSNQSLAGAIMAFVNGHPQLSYTGQGRISPNFR